MGPLGKRKVPLLGLGLIRERREADSPGQAQRGKNKRTTLKRHDVDGNTHF